MIEDRYGSSHSEFSLPRFAGPRLGYRRHSRRLKCADRAKPRLTCVLGYSLGRAGFGMDIAPPTGFCFYRDPPRLMFRVSPLSPFCSRATTELTTMRSLLLVLTALPLASFALIISHVDNGAESSAYKNGTTSSGYRLQRKHQGDTFFKYVKAWSFFLFPH